MNLTFIVPYTHSDGVKMWLYLSYLMYQRSEVN